jgi:DNA topoisomerase I
MGTILDRGYVRKQGQALVPEFLAFAVMNLLERHFPRLVDYEFTARMEDDLDEIAGGDESRTEWLRRFYFGNGGDDNGLKALVEQHLGDIDAREINTVPLPRTDIVVRVGKYGPYLERGEDRQTLPPDVAPDELTPERAEEILAQGNQEHELGADPETGRMIVVRNGRYGPYVTEILEEGVEGKPRTASLLKTMAPETVTLEDALRLLTLPRTLGESDGEEVIAANGRYGPYVKKGKESRSLDAEEELFTVTLEQALARLAQPKQRGRRAAAPPLKELGEDPVSKQPVVLKEGRFGPYVTDGETNASLRAGDSAESITPARAAELLQDRRERGPVKKKRATKKRS